MSGEYDDDEYDEEDFDDDDIEEDIEDVEFSDHSGDKEPLAETLADASLMMSALAAGVFREDADKSAVSRSDSAGYPQPSALENPVPLAPLTSSLAPSCQPIAEEDAAQNPISLPSSGGLSAEERSVRIAPEAPSLAAPCEAAAEEAEEPTTGDKRCKQRKGTGFIKAGMLPISGDEDEDEDETPRANQTEAFDHPVHGMTTEEWGPEASRTVRIRRTIQEETIGWTEADIEARRGAEDPDLDKLNSESVERISEKKSGENRRRTSISDDKDELIPRDQEEPILDAKRCIGRKGTGFLQQMDMPSEEDDDIEDWRAADYPEKSGERKRKTSISDEKDELIPRDQEEPIVEAKRCRGRKGTGFVKNMELPSEDEDDEIEDSDKLDSESADRLFEEKPGQNKRRTSISNETDELIPRDQEEPVVEAKRSRGRKGTGFVKTKDLPSDEEDDEIQEEPGKLDEEPAAEAKRSQGRKGIGFVKTMDLPSEEDDDGIEEPAAEVKRCQGRKGTGFVKTMDLPSEEDDDGIEELAAEAKRCQGRKGTGFVKTKDLPSEEDDDGIEDELATDSPGEYEKDLDNEFGITPDDADIIHTHPTESQYLQVSSGNAGEENFGADDIHFFLNGAPTTAMPHASKHGADDGDVDGASHADSERESSAGKFDDTDDPPLERTASNSDQQESHPPPDSEAARWTAVVRSWNQPRIIVPVPADDAAAEAHSRPGSRAQEYLSRLPRLDESVAEEEQQSQVPKSSRTPSAAVSDFSQKDLFPRPSTDPGGSRAGTETRLVPPAPIEHRRASTDVKVVPPSPTKARIPHRAALKARSHTVRTSTYASRGPTVLKRQPSVDTEVVATKIKEAYSDEEGEALDDEDEYSDEEDEEEYSSEASTPQVVNRVELTNVRPSLLAIEGGKLEGMLWEFEGHESRVDAQARLRKQVKRRRGEVVREADRFLNMMKEKGGGSVTIAWRRHFDSDGDGELSFIEFCNALADLHYEVDTIKLWQQFGGGDSNTKQLGLEVLDPQGAEVLDFFAKWCKDVLGGPLEVFRAMDADGSDSLEPDEFVDGLHEMGFFELENLPHYLNDADKCLQYLYPLLDQNGFGTIQAEQMLFLETDREKRERQGRELQRIRDFGSMPSVREAPKDAEKILHETAVGSTQLGGTFWKMIPENNHCGSPSRSGTGSKRMTPTSARSRTASTGSRHTAGGQNTPKDAAGLPSDAPIRSSTSPLHRSTSSAAVVTGTAGKFAPPVLASSASLPQLPNVAAGQRHVAAKRNNAEIRMRGTQKLRGARCIYSGTLTSSLPTVAKEQERRGTPLVLPQRQKQHAKAGRGTAKFDPRTSVPMDFFRSIKGGSLFDHYYRSDTLTY